MEILVACEESQAVTKELRRLGHEAYSCDIIDQSGGHPEWHIMQDVLPLLNGRCIFKTADGANHSILGSWDAVIAFPPCTFLTSTGNRWFNVERYGEKALKRHRARAEAAAFFMAIATADCERIIIENPIGVMSSLWRKPDQIVHPYYFAEQEDDINCERKATCLWLIGVPPLKYEIKYTPRVIHYKNGKGTDSPWHMETIKLPAAERAKARSKTYPGIAKAIAEQLIGPCLTVTDKEDDIAWMY